MDIILPNYWWPGMAGYTKWHSKRCQKCQGIMNPSDDQQKVVSTLPRCTQLSPCGPLQISSCFSTKTFKLQETYTNHTFLLNRWPPFQPLINTKGSLPPIYGSSIMHLDSLTESNGIFANNESTRPKLDTFTEGRQPIPVTAVICWLAEITKKPQAAGILPSCNQTQTLLPWKMSSSSARPYQLPTLPLMPPSTIWLCPLIVFVSSAKPKPKEMMLWNSSPTSNTLVI